MTRSQPITSRIEEPTVFVALGSNLGDSARLLERALERLQQFSDQPVLKSSLWRSEPVDCPPGSAAFINAAAAWVPRPTESPLRLLRALQNLEKEFGRTPKTVANEPRMLDLDLIAYGAVVCSGPELTLPHPRAHLRRFVLAPLAEIAPGWCLPGQTKTVQQLLDGFGVRQPVTRVAPH